MRPATMRRLLGVALSCILTVVACTGDDGPTEPTPDPTLALSVSPTSLTLEQGTEATVTVSVTRGGGFEGAVSVTVQGLPQGVTAASLDVAAGSTTGTLTLSAGAEAAAGTASLTVQGTGSGVDPASATLSLEVTEAPDEPAGGFVLGVDPASLEVEQGSSGEVTVSVTRTDPFEGEVTLEVSGLPEGVTASVDPSSVAGASAAVELTAEASAAAGESTVTVSGSGEGVEDQSVTFSLTVTEAPDEPTGSFSLALSTGSLSLQQGQSGTVSVAVSREAPFEGAVELAVSGAPAGVTATVDPTSVSGDEATLQVSASAEAALGDATLTLTGTADGVPDRSVELALTVTAPPAGTDYSWTFCPDVPVWFAVKDGDAAWTAVAATGNRFDFSLSSDRAGIAYVVESGGDSELTMRFLGADEIEAAGASLCPGGRTVTGTVSGAASGNTFVSMGDADAVVTAQVGSSFTLENLREGTVDLLGATSSLDVQGSSVSSSLETIYLERGLNPMDGGSVTVDFGGANAFAPGSATLTTTGLNGEATTMTMLYLTEGNNGILFQELGFSSQASRSFPTVPADRQEAGDLHLLQLTTRATGAQGVLGDTRTASVYFEAPEDRELDFGPVLGTTDLTTASTAPYVMPRVQYSQQAEYGRYFLAGYSQSAGAGTTVQAFLTDDYIGGADIDFTVPDFSSLPGWDDSWGLQTGVETTYTFVSSGWQGGGVIAPGTVSAGLQVMTASRFGTFTP